jgi:large conductance mechanosensitive channel
MLKDFKAFILRGNVLDLAVAVVIGAAFGAVVKSFTDDVIMPPIGLALGHIDFSNLFVVLKEGSSPGPYTTVAKAHEAGAVTLNYGAFINSLVTFLIIAFCVFMIVRMVSKLYAKPVPPPDNMKSCPRCTLSIPKAASRCPNCTSDVAAA